MKGKVQPEDEEPHQREPIHTREMKEDFEDESAFKDPKVHKVSSTFTVDSEHLISGREFNETLLTKLKFMARSIIGLGLTIVLYWILQRLGSDDGLSLAIKNSSFDHAGPVLLILFMYLTHTFVLQGMNDALSAYVGYLLCSKRGYSIATCGFIQGNFLQKILFSSKLSYKSKAKRFLSRLAMFWLLHGLSLIFCLFSSTQLRESEQRFDFGTTPCIIYHQEGEPSDRGWPTIEVEMGVAEYIFGNSIGIMRSQTSEPNTTFVMSPQLIGVADQGTTLFGRGFIHTIFAQCQCSGSDRIEDLVKAGVEPDVVNQMADLLNSLNRNPGLVNSIKHDLALQQVNITTLYPGTPICGGNDIYDPPVPVCKVTFSDMYHGVIEARYMTDGNPASIATEGVKIRNKLERSNSTWLHFALTALLGGNVSAFSLPSTFAGAVNPMMWWTTPNMQVSSASLLEEGLETTMSMIGKVAIQRSYGTRGSKCPTSVISQTNLILNIEQTGFVHGIIFFVCQLVALFISFLAYIPWIFSENPIGPAMRLCYDKGYFTTMMSRPSVAKYLNEITPNCEKAYMWPKMDVVLRVGETIDTMSDPDEGILTIDKPKTVCYLSRSKAYS